MNRGKKLLMAGTALAALVAAALTIGAGRGDRLETSGTVEARNIRMGSKIGGRVTEVLVREGDRVAAGQALVRFDDAELQAQLQQARGRVAQARAQLEKLEHGYRPEEIAEARAAAAQARAQMQQAQAGYRTEQVLQAEADRERAEADARNAERQFRRIAPLADEGVFSRQQRDDAEAGWKMAVARLRMADERLSELKRGYRGEDVAAAEARYAQAQAVLERLERGYRAEDIAAARAELDRAQGELLHAQARHDERQITAPSAAVVEVLDVRPGDLIAPNTPIATLLEQDQLYVRVFVPETRIGQVRVGQRAEVRVDSFPGETFAAEVEQINQKAEFLPRNVQTREERVHQVFGVKLRVRDPSGRLRAGMAADVKL